MALPTAAPRLYPRPDPRAICRALARTLVSHSARQSPSVGASATPNDEHVLGVFMNAWRRGSLRSTTQCRTMDE